MEYRKKYPKLAIAAAVLLTLCGGLAYRAAADRYARPPDSVQLPPGTLAKLPLDIDDWHGREVPLDEAIVKATDTDQHVNRAYTRRGSPGGVSLFVAYGVRARDLMPHRPEVCYPGAGWTLRDRRDVDLDLADGLKLPCRILRFDRGGLTNRQILVLNYYVVDGEYSPDVELLRSKIWQLSSGVNYVAQVQIVCSGSTIGRSAEEAARAFATASARPIHSLFPSDAERVNEEQR